MTHQTTPTISPSSAAGDVTETAARSPRHARTVLIVLLLTLVAALAVLAVLEPPLVGDAVPGYVSGAGFDVAEYEAALARGPVCEQVDTTVLEGTVACRAYDERGGLPFAILSLVVAALGAALVLRWRNAVGWLLVLAVLADRLGAAADVWATTAIHVEPASLPLGTAAALVASTAWIPLMVVIVPAICMRLPGGGLHASGWRWAARFTYLAAAVIAAVVALSPVWVGSVPNPAGLGWSVDTADGVFGTVMLGMLASWALGGLALLVRTAGWIRRRTAA